MKLIECYIENFGKLSDFKYSFSSGLVSIKKDNGFGKTTLSVFIKAMLYGLEDTRKVKLEENDRKHYMPWQGGRCGGSLTFEKDGVRYRVERTFSPKAADDVFKLYYADTGAECKDYSDKIGEELFSIDADGFERTVFLSEANLSGKNENKSVSAKLSDLSGTVGDLSVMDDAIELLEKQRKIYYKKGGAGEIEQTRAKIRDIDLEINDILKIREKCEEEEEKLKEAAEELRILKEKRKTLAEEERKAAERKLKRTYEKQYLEMMRELGEEKERKKALTEFFAAGLPSTEDVSKAEDAYAESKRLKALESASGISSEYTELAEFFSTPMSEEEITEAEKLLIQIDAVRDSAQRIRKDIKDTSSPLFKNRAPSTEKVGELISNIETAKKKHLTPKSAILLALSALIIICGAFFGAFIFLAIGLSIPLIVIAIISNKQGYKKAENEAKEFINSTLATAPKYDDVYKELFEIKMECEKVRERENEKERDEEEIRRLESETETATKKLSEFINRFPIPESLGFIEAIKLIRRKHELFRIISKNEADRVKEMQDSMMRARILMEKAREFYSQFPVATDEPFNEIREKLIEYSSSARAVERMQNSLILFVKEHSIIPEEIKLDDDIIEEKIEDAFILDDKIADCEKRKAFYDNKLRIAGEFIEKLEPLYSERDALSEKESEYTEKLETIKKTQKYLSEAKDLLTSKYLAKTKAAFNKYVEAISEDVGDDFKMDTSFSIMKNERGTLRSTESYSRGTRELYALAARLALIDSLYENEEPFIILDDPFAYFDDKRLSSALAMLKKLSKDKQIIYLTCAGSRLA